MKTGDNRANRGCKFRPKLNKELFSTFSMILVITMILWGLISDNDSHLPGTSNQIAPDVIIESGGD